MIIDVSENNGFVDFGALQLHGATGVIIRLGYGNRHLDSKFYDYINDAIRVGLDVGVYYYSYALDEEDALNEADFVLDTLVQAGLSNDRLKLGIWFDMEDADNYKANRGGLSYQGATNICSVFINHIWSSGYNCGLYANLDWLTNRIDVSQLGGVSVWCAQYNRSCDYDGATLWQYTDRATINGQLFDASVCI